MDHNKPKTCVLKVNISCCNACPERLKRLLLKIKGIDSVSVDTEKELVSVTGQVDSMHLIKKIKKKMGKKALLMEPEENAKEPEKNQQKTENATYAPENQHPYDFDIIQHFRGHHPNNNQSFGGPHDCCSDGHWNYPPPASSSFPSAPPDQYIYYSPRMTTPPGYGGAPSAGYGGAPPVGYGGGAPPAGYDVYCGTLPTGYGGAPPTTYGDYGGPPVMPSAESYGNLFPPSGHY